MRVFNADVGQELTFNIYGTTVSGEFVKYDDKSGSITIKTTRDLLCKLGEEQNIHIDHMLEL